jgi:hypothetical protein
VGYCQRRLTSSKKTDAFDNGERKCLIKKYGKPGGPF